MHIVHGAFNAKGNIDSLLVVGIFFSIDGDNDNEFLQTIQWEEAPTTETHTAGTAIPDDVDLTYFDDVLSGEFWRYKGSLTTPTCAEIVEWHVMKTPVTMSQSQYDYFQAIFPNPSNVRLLWLRLPCLQSHPRSTGRCSRSMDAMSSTRPSRSAQARHVWTVLTSVAAVWLVKTLCVPRLSVATATSRASILTGSLVQTALSRASGARARQEHGRRATVCISHR